MARCERCRQVVSDIWDANGDRWKLEDHDINGRRCVFSGASVVPGGGQVQENRHVPAEPPRTPEPEEPELIGGWPTKLKWVDDREGPELTRAERNALGDEAMRMARKERAAVPERPDPRLAELEAENAIFRRLLWCAHAIGDGGYGDDGELQWQMRCDFKRDSAERIDGAIYKRGLEKLAARKPSVDQLAELLAAATDAERALLPHIGTWQRDAAAYARLRAAVAAFEEEEE